MHKIDIMTFAAIAALVFLVLMGVGSAIALFTADDAFQSSEPASFIGGFWAIGLLAIAGIAGFRIFGVEFAAQPRFSFLFCGVHAVVVSILYFTARYLEERHPSVGDTIMMNFYYVFEPPVASIIALTDKLYPQALSSAGYMSPAIYLIWLIFGSPFYGCLPWIFRPSVSGA